MLVFLLLLLLGVSVQQRIEWHESSMDYKTGCNKKLVNKVDDIIYRCDIYLADRDDIPEHVEFFLLKKNSVLHTLCLLDLRKCQGNWKEYCYCQRSNSTNIYKVTINSTAYEAYSEATLQGKMCFPNKPVFSSEQRLPVIFDPKNVSTHLLVNNQLVNETACNVTTNDYVVLMKFKVIEIPNVPYILEIKDHPSGTVLKSSINNDVDLKQTLNGPAKFSFSLVMCNIQEYKRSFDCEFLPPPKVIDDVKSDMKIVIIIIVLIIVSIICILLCCILKRCANCTRFNFPCFNSNKV
ncbi:hypothetical protein Btru_071748 [Bulinus truncatus]|nr:hypothetical protein Btru_071748 [Bulinus truncatus]